ncbi:MAG: hypothetical protein LBK13_13275 [Spirochaetales bacterium]|nr:hypothetical protein [Spirochaetales bacterium]
MNTWVNFQNRGVSWKTKPPRRLFLFAACVFVTLSGCGTTPPELPEAHPSAALSADADAYFYLSVTENMELLRDFTESGGSSTLGSRYFLEHSNAIYGAVSKSQGGAGFLIAASGDYSVGLVEFGIGTDDAWMDASVFLAEGEARYYRNMDTGMEIAIPSPRLILMGSGVAESLAWLHAGASSPLGDDICAALESHRAGFYLPKAAKTGLPPFIPAGSPLPLQEALLFVDPSAREGLYTASGELLFADNRNAAGAAVMLRLAFSGLMTQQGYSLAEIRQNLKLFVEARTILFSGLPFPRELARLVLFSLMMVEENR